MDMKRKIKLKNVWLHLRKIQIHRKWVRHYCFLAGIPWRGITHDLSKYSPTEFWESVKFYQGTSSPINEAKKQQGISYAWLHHKGRNRHHYEYWMDNFDNGGIARQMPCNDFVEAVCDMLGANRAYLNSKETDVYKACQDYWRNHKQRGCAMNQNNQYMMDRIWWDLTEAEEKCYSPEEMIKNGYIQRIWRMFADE
jgi:hypothetical protein